MPPSSSLTTESTDVAESLRLITIAIKWAQKYADSTPCHLFIATTRLKIRILQFYDTAHGYRL